MRGEARETSSGFNHAFVSVRVGVNALADAGDFPVGDVRRHVSNPASDATREYHHDTANCAARLAVHGRSRCVVGNRAAALVVEYVNGTTCGTACAPTATPFVEARFKRQRFRVRTNEPTVERLIKNPLIYA